MKLIVTYEITGKHPSHLIHTSTDLPLKTGLNAMNNQLKAEDIDLVLKIEKTELV